MTNPIITYSSVLSELCNIIAIYSMWMKASVTMDAPETIKLQALTLLGTLTCLFLPAYWLNKTAVSCLVWIYPNYLSCWIPCRPALSDVATQITNILRWLKFIMCTTELTRIASRTDIFISLKSTSCNAASDRCWSRIFCRRSRATSRDDVFGAKFRWFCRPFIICTRRLTIMPDLEL